MRKRPLFSAACILAFFIWLLAGVFGLSFDPEPIPAGKAVRLSGRIRTMEEKGERTCLFLQDVMCRSGGTDGEKIRDTGSKKEDTGTEVPQKEKGKQGTKTDDEETGNTGTEAPGKEKGKQGTKTDDEETGNMGTEAPGKEKGKQGTEDSENEKGDSGKEEKEPGTEDLQNGKGEPGTDDTGIEDFACGYRKILLVADRSDIAALDLKPGNRVLAEASVTGFSVARNMGNYDEGAYYRAFGVQEKFRLKGELTVTDASYFPVRTLLSRARSRLTEALTTLTVENAHAGIFAAIVTGDRSALDPESKDLYQKSGIAHILAISGLHISFLGMSLYSILRKKMRFAFAALMAGTLMILFCMMSGESASAVRATLMFLLRLLAIRTGRRFDLLSALGFSAISLLAVHPLLIGYSGFLLSFGAILGIGVLAPAVGAFLEKENEDPFSDMEPESRLSAFLPAPKKVRSAVKASLIASLSVTLVTLPVIMNTYYQIPLFSVFLNLLVVPLMGLVLETGVFGALFGLLSLFAGRMVIGAGVYLISLIEFLCGLIDRIPFSIVITGPMPAYRTVLYYLILLLFLLFVYFSRMKKGVGSKAPHIRKRLIDAICVLLTLSLTIFVHVPSSSLSLTFLDVDQGESILIESPSGEVFLIDGGSTSVSQLYRYRMKSALKYRRIAQIDHVIITHPDSDHISGILSMLEESGADRIRIRDVMIPKIPENAHYQEILEQAEEAGVPVTDLYAGLTINDGRVRFRCLHPSRSYKSAEANGYSAVMELTYGDFKALLTGDLEEDGEKLLLRENALSDVDLLKVAHHGSKHSSTEAFLKAVAPETAVISAGVRNSYGHPHKETRQRLENIGADIFVTAEEGEIFVTAEADGRYHIRTLLGG